MPGMARIGKIIPIAPVASETWRKGHVTAIAAAIAASPPRRSTQAARLKNSHQMTRASPPPMPANTP